MIGIAVDGTAYILSNNKSVLCNTMILDSALNKKAQNIAYDLVQEGAARGEWRAAYVNTK